jgi:hypothetical protein
MKTYEVGYEVTFYDTVQVEARSKAEAMRKFKELERDGKAFAEADGDAGPTRITYVKVTKEARP